jgi:signal transduction histidine kinase
MSPSGGAQLTLPVTVAMLGGVYVAGVGAVVFAPSGDPVASWWPAAGIAVALIALAPRRWWWRLAVGIAVVSALANVTGGRSPELSAVFGIANAAEAIVAGAFLRRGRDDIPDLSSLDQFVQLVVAAVLGAVTIATIASFGAAVLDDGDFIQSWRSVACSHAASVLVIVPVAMARNRPPPPLGWELPVQVLSLLAVTLAVFSPDQSLSLTFVPLPFLVWGALRFDVRIAAWELVGFGIAATLLTSRGFGPFGYDFGRGALDAIEVGTLVQAYLLAAALMTLPLAITIDNRRRLLERVTSSELLFRRNFTESLVGMALLNGVDGDRLFEITDLNDAAVRLLGSDESWVGRDLGDVLDTDEQLDEIAGRMLAGDLDGWKTQTGVRGSPGTRINASVSLLTREPEVIFSAQLEDVTQEYAAIEKERLAAVRLRELDHAKDELITTVSHELRTPLTSIVGYTELLQDGPATPEQKRLLGSIERNGNRLLALSNDLLVLGSLEWGQAHELRETIDLRVVVDSAMDALGPIATDRRVVLTQVPVTQPVLVLGDPSQLERVLLNVLGNAVKFTEAGGRAECRIEVHDDEGWLRVSDTGIGIPADEQAGMFRPFFRSSTTRQREIQGTGLGLSIAAAIVEAHGGRIDVRSAHLEGTTVTIRLRLADAVAPRLRWR